MLETSPAKSDSDPIASIRTEWLLTAGTGAFAMGTALGVSTRRYHGLLVASVHPPVGRVMALHSVIDFIETGGRRIDLATQQFDEGRLLHPEGWRHLASFRVQPPDRATWIFRIDDLRVTRRLHMHPSLGAVTIRYEVEGAHDPVRLLVRPLTPLRDFHEIGREPMDAPVVHRADAGSVRVERRGVGLRLEHEAGGWQTDPQWWRGLVYSEDRDRGQEWIEDVWSPGTFSAALRHDHPVEIHARLDLPTLAEESVGGAPADPGVAGAQTESARRMKEASRQFIVTRRVGGSDGQSIIAGFPWFTDWGRDTMISLPGLLLVPGRLATARQVLHTYAGNLRRGLLPNAFDDDGEGASYHTADASLWFVHAVRAYARRSGDADLTDLLDACRAVVAAYRDGTDFGIGMDEADGLMGIGDGAVCLTWMDAARGGVRFTPRDGKPVEINALWYNALRSLAELTDDAAEEQRLRALAEQVAKSMQTRFWWERRACLYDVLVPGCEDSGVGAQLRPNQIFAVSLPFSPITDDQQRAVVAAVRARLLTPFGLRTLEPDVPSYIGRYEGDLMHRDAAYHNGTVWPWLIGPYCTAVLRAGSFGAAALAEARSAIEPLLATLDSGCLHHVAEVYDGDPPHRPSGCPAQAWSIAELQRVLAMLEQRRDAGLA